MPAAARIGDRINTGHGCDTTAPIAQGSSDVFVNGIGLSYRGAAIVPHLIPCGKTCCGHGAVINVGSSSVFVNSIPVARVGDSADMGAVAQGSPNVFAGG
ncbi:PAAR domain-containing protein [Lamprobacter modestohalophilus]|uniref:PAAR domain-containing protein n=1 Tax=Lamprobacter modestohalophilus TaxID=1064514 RepID=UPI002ADEC870|nr:PAAR domain-containing protein [Lamprobacter modestohalophilus]MEA1052360.1 PAAR domain-containing protein [Lamprobacter modestohalophilus]